MRRYNCRRLTVEEQDALAIRAKAGDMEARNRLVESVIPMIAGRVTKCSSRDEDQEDYVQEAAVKIIESIERFEPDLGSFVSYIATWAEGGRHAWLRKQTWIRNYSGGQSFVSIERPVFAGSSKTIAEIVPSELGNDGESVCLQREIRNALRHVKVNEREMELLEVAICTGIGDGFQNRAAKTIGISRQRVNQLWLGKTQVRPGLLTRLRRALKPLACAV